MPPLTIVLVLLVLAATGYVLGRKRAIASADGDVRTLHSLPNFYGLNVAIMTFVPAFLVLLVWLLAQPMVIENRVSATVPDSAIAEGMSHGLFMTEVRRLADGLDLVVDQGAMTEGQVRVLSTDDDDVRDVLAGVGAALGNDVRPEQLAAAQIMRAQTANGSMLMLVIVVTIAIVGLIYSVIVTSKDFRARNAVERGVFGLLLLAASLAILTTIGIVLSMVFEAANFFGLHSWRDFFFGITWAPNFRGGSELSVLPLLWGTLYISMVALLVAVPVGLFSAIYLSEYASKSMRAFAKPLLEILAGIPTIVYGLFALLTVGPLLVRVFGEGENSFFGLGWMSGATSVLTAGVVMGVMLIPFVSSLSDDIINAVPQSLRDGALGLGATKSETIRSVVVPAALPGIVGAILLAASRAIGETMIVVMGAGAIAKFSANPLESMTTITTRIVSQLTGDTDFASPETLVAFALGLSLFVLTLGLNVLALYIVRKYREQYE
jgi:phosphate transport system permease protein